MVCVPHSGKPEEKNSFWNKVLNLMSCIPQNEMVVLAGDMNGYAGSSIVRHDWTHGGFGYRDRILRVCRRANLVICNTFFKKQEYQLVICSWSH